jgi:Schlafen, AlbA_2
MPDPKKLLERAKSAIRESKHLDFKREFDPASGQAWCEVIKDIVAMANSGGGIIVFGVANDGSNAEFNSTPLLACDTADIANRIARYTGNQLVDIEVIEIERNGQARATFIVPDTDVPIVFTKPGTYDIGGGQQKTAFGQGTIYFRHGSKSEPGNRDDLANWRDREISKVRKSWLGGIRKVVQAEANDTVTVISSPRTLSKGTPVILAKAATDPSALTVVPGNAEEIWPYRQKDLINEVNKRLGQGVRINTHDIFCIKRVFDVLNKRPDFAYRPHHLAAPQYSEAFAAWIVSEFQKDNEFFERVRHECRSKS